MPARAYLACHFSVRGSMLTFHSIQVPDRIAMRPGETGSPVTLASCQASQSGAAPAAVSLTNPSLGHCASAREG